MEDLRKISKKIYVPGKNVKQTVSNDVFIGKVLKEWQIRNSWSNNQNYFGLTLKTNYLNEMFFETNILLENINLKKREEMCEVRKSKISFAILILQVLYFYF
jgi:hypothetical protein